jgi:antitoxin component YwqK of YwqJK toxin-antitoxin module
MLKYCVSILLLLTISFTVRGQAFRIYLAKNGDKTTDYRQAQSYILYKNIDDSVWLVNQYNMHDQLLAVGTYKDDQLTIPHGKFSYYSLVVHSEIKNGHLVIDTLVKISSTGFYLNGVKAGVWLHYYADGKKAYIVTYEKGKLNGPCEAYNQQGKITLQGNFVNDARDGDWCKVRPDTTVIIAYRCKNGVSKKTTFYNSKDSVDAYPEFDFNNYVVRYARGVSKTANGALTIEFTVDKSGYLQDPKLISNFDLDLDVDQAVVEAILHSPKWVPALNNKKKRVEQKRTYSLILTSPKQSPNLNLNNDPSFN